MLKILPISMLKGIFYQIIRISVEKLLISGIRTAYFN